MIDRKSGIRQRRSREAARVRRDRKILRNLRVAANVSHSLHKILREPREPLSVYVGKLSHRQGDLLTRFPITTQDDGRPMPPWNDLSLWMKVQLAVMVMHEWSFQTFNIHIHPDLEMKWVAADRDPRIMMRDRIRRELDRHVRSNLDWFFVVEGWSPKNGETLLHVHGGAASFEIGDDRKIMTAVSRAAGHGIRGYSHAPRAVHGRPFSRHTAGYVDYLFKATRRKDDRLGERRVTMSRTMSGGARAFWELVTGQEAT